MGLSGAVVDVLHVIGERYLEVVLPVGAGRNRNAISAEPGLLDCAEHLYPKRPQAEILALGHIQLLLVLLALVCGPADHQ